LALECALTSIHSSEGAQFIMWLVHEENTQMRNRDPPMMSPAAVPVE